MSEFNQTKYITEYVKDHYIRKEIRFKQEEWEQVKKYLEKHKTTLKKIIIEKTKD